MNFKPAGTWFSNKNIDLVTLEDGHTYALDGWTGETYTNCWRVIDTYEASEERYTLRPVQVADDDEETSFTTIGYEMAYF